MFYCCDSSGKKYWHGPIVNYFIKALLASILRKASALAFIAPLNLFLIEHRICHKKKLVYSEVFFFLQIPFSGSICRTYACWYVRAMHRWVPFGIEI